MTEQWGIFEIELEGPSSGNPFTEVEIGARFQYRNRVVPVDGFYDGDGRYKIRFSPDRVGTWTYTTSSSATELDGHTGSFEASPPSTENHGPVRVVGRDRLQHVDGTRHESYGTTCYHWTHGMDEEQERLTLESFARSPFNKVRMCLLPTSGMRPPRLAFAGTTPEKLDRTRFDPEFFAHLEERITDLLALGVQVDLILFHPYDKGHWGVDNMTPEEDRFLLRYTIARLAAFRHIWWSVSNEFDFNAAKSMQDWDRLLQYVQRIDPYQRMLSIHNGTRMYEYASVFDFSKPWTTHQSIQHWDARLAAGWLAEHPKPVVIDEIGYEGDLEKRWGNLAPQDMTRRFWEGMTSGAFVGHGECFVDEDKSKWIARGGRLSGESPARIDFLREIIAAAPEDRTAARLDGTYRLEYFGERRPAYLDVELGEDDHLIEVIDTWAMSITALEGTFRGSCRIPLEGRPDLAVRITRQKEAA